MPTLQDLSAQMVGEIPGLPYLFARNYINQALDEISRESLWSWNINEGIIIAPQLVTTGAVDVTRYSNTVQFNATAQAALNPLVLANPPLNQRQFRVGSGPIYNLVAYDDTTGIGTLDRIYMEATATGQLYQIYRCYYSAPSNDGTTPVYDFLRYLSILDPINGYTIAGNRLTMTREKLNRRDPMRGAQGQPYYVATYRPTPNLQTTGEPDRSSPLLQGMMQYEWWPHPVYGQEYLVQYERQNLQLQPNEYLPNQMPPNLVRYKAWEFGYRWAQTNMSRVPELKGVNWPLLLNEVQKKYSVELVGAKRNDQEIQTTIIRPGTAGIMDFFGPIDSNWAQSHGVASWL